MVEELAEEQKRLIEFGKWEVGMRGSADGKEELDAAIREGKPIPSGEAKGIEETAAGVENGRAKEVNKEVDKKDDKKGNDNVVRKSSTPSHPVNAEGKPISVDQHWKQFMSTKSAKKGAMKRSSSEKNKSETDSTNVKRTKTLFDDEPEMGSRKKIPLRQKK